MPDVKQQDLSLFLLRSGLGLPMAILHGWPKLSAAYSYWTVGANWGFVTAVQNLGFPFPALFASVAALAESAGAILIVLGLGRRWPAIALAFTMLIAIYRHLSQGQSAELAFLYLLALTPLIYLGGGKLTLERALSRPGSN